MTAARLPVIESPLLDALPGLRHGFFTRQGGASTGIYASLNCGLGSNDERTIVLANRDRVASQLGAPVGSVTTVHQCHSAVALTIDAPFPDGRIPKADALVTRTPGLVIGALAADCTPVLFAAPDAGIVAAAHAGWRGAVGGILEATIAAMMALGAHRSDIRAAVGPCIHAAHYEVGPEFEARFLAAAPGNARFFHVPAGRPKAHFDLPGYVAHRLQSAGIEHLEPSRHCTYEHRELFFSYRRTTHLGEPDYGRQISAIVVT
jgi:polyphenol oxidase